MSRPSTQDFLQNCNFWAESTGPAGSADAATDFLHPERSADGSESGFNQITTPEISTDAAEYREGHRAYTMKFPGTPTVSDVTYNQGTVLYGTGFYDWMAQKLFGGVGEFRADITVYHFPRQIRNTDGTLDLSRKDKAKKRNDKNCFPIRVKPHGDLDAGGTDVSISEIDVAIESFTYEAPKAE